MNQFPITNLLISKKHGKKYLLVTEFISSIVYINIGFISSNTLDDTHYPFLSRRCLFPVSPFPFRALVRSASCLYFPLILFLPVPPPPSSSAFLFFFLLFVLLLPSPPCLYFSASSIFFRFRHIRFCPLHPSCPLSIIEWRATRYVSSLSR